MASANPTNLELFSFGSNFLKDHAGHIISDPRTAITELISNAYDAGATVVEIQWPDNAEGQFSISDNGIGMTAEEFDRRWKELSYDRLKEQGSTVEFPPGVAKRQRTAFGRNGKGRHATFCYADEYVVETRKAGKRLVVKVSLTNGGQSPFRCERTIEEQALELGPGTTIKANLTRGKLPAEDIFEVIGSKFIVDPSFTIFLNSKQVELFELKHQTSQRLLVGDFGELEIFVVDMPSADRSSKLKGLTWWVNERMVGEPSWDGLDGDGSILDGRKAEAKRFSFIIRADLLRDEVKADWSGFNATLRSNEVKKVVREFVIKALHEALAEGRRARKRAALDENRQILRELPEQSKLVVAQFVEQVQEQCPRLSDADLSRTVEIYAKLEQTRSGYDLLKKLASCSPDDLDSWNAIMSQWSASNATVVLNELGERLTLLSKLQILVNDKKSDEVHDLQPLFERGLWMFGPEFESIDFRSNRGMAEVIQNFFGKDGVAASRKRPDFVALVDSSIGAYAADGYSESGEVFGYRKVLIVELKRGGFTLTQKEVDQARDYIKEIRNAGCVSKATKVEAYILGSQLEEGLEKTIVGESVMIPYTYDNLLTRAHSRTFHLHQKLESNRPKTSEDPDLLEVLSISEPIPMFTQ